MDEYAPLTEATYMILLALTASKHGYGIMRRVEQISKGRVSMGPGTLYGVLKGLVKKGWIIEEEGDESRRRNYVLTSRGQDGLQKEIERLGRLAELGTQTLKGTEEHV